MNVAILDVSDPSELTRFTIAELTEFYNTYATRPIKRFKDKVVARKKCWPLLTKQHICQPDTPLIGGNKKKVSKKKVAKKVSKKKVAKKVSKKKVTSTSKAGAKKKAPGIGNEIRELLIKGLSTNDILERVAKKFPDSKAKADSIAWYRCKLKQEGAL